MIEIREQKTWKEISDIGEARRPVTMYVYDRPEEFGVEPNENGVTVFPLSKVAVDIVKREGKEVIRVEFLELHIGEEEYYGCDCRHCNWIH